ncbi:hypothetical protein GCM10027164_36200 [Algoriphagus taiwanensis]
MEQPLVKDIKKLATMLTFILWCILFVLCWPIAIVALVLYPIIWLLLLPFRLIGFAVDLSFDLVRNIFMLPFRLVGYK